MFVCDEAGPRTPGTMTRLALVFCLLTAACGDDGGGGGPGSGTITGTCDPGMIAGSSFERITAALDAGLIDSETALELKVFAQFQDARLPAECVGDDSDVSESDAIDQIYASWETLSPAAQEILEPFLAPPAYVGSWASPAPKAKARPAVIAPQSPCDRPTLDENWASRPLDDQGYVKVWYDKRFPGQETLAQTVADAVNKDIWDKLTTGAGGLGMIPPLSDATSLGCTGGDARLDIYLGSMSGFGQAFDSKGATKAVTYALKAHSVFLMLNRNLGEKALIASTTHELMHACQWAYSVAGFSLPGSYPWLKEATAQWAIDFVYPTLVDNYEQKKAPPYLMAPDVSLDKTNASGDDNHAYGSYLFFQFLAHREDPHLVSAIWAKTIMESKEVAAVDSTIPGGFHKQWHEFAKYLWNQDPINGSSFEFWDKLMMYPALKDEFVVALGGQPSLTLTLDGNMDHLTSRYYRFAFNTNDPTVRSVVVSAPDSRITVQAFEQKKGSIREWKDFSNAGTGNFTQHYCIDVAAERLTELVVVLSNDDPVTDNVSVDLLQPRIVVTSVGCWRYQGSVTIVTDDPSGGLHQTVNSDVILEKDQGATWVNDYFIHYIVRSGTSAADATQTGGGCTTTSSAAAQALPTGETGGGKLDVGLGFDLGAGNPAGRKVQTGSGTTTMSTQWLMVCTTSQSSGTDPYFYDWLEQPMQTINVRDDGTFGVNVLEPYGDGTKQYTWSFTPLREPDGP